MRAAASLILLRDSADGPEVLLVKRGPGGDFPGLHVFPGGLVDAADGDPRLRRRSRLHADAANALLAHTDALPAFLAALRETLEETGLLPGSDEVDADTRVQWQETLHRRSADFATVLGDHPLRLATDSLGYFSHWITPEGIPRRYDTRFFVTRMPAAQQVRVDGRETVQADWFRPADALAAHERGDIGLIFPTIRNLAALAGYASVDALLAETLVPRSVPAMLPRLLNTAAGVKLLLPGDDGYEI